MFEPENDLERNLVRAAAEPGRWPAFLRAMFNGTTFIALGFDGEPPAPNAAGKLVLPEGTKLTLRPMRSGDEDYLPFFTAPARARATVRGKHLIVPGVTRELFERYFGQPFILNPGHDHARAFSSEDVNHMLAGQFGAVVSPSAPAAAAIPAVTKPATAAPASAAKVSTDKPPATEPSAAKPAAAKPAAAKPVVSKPVVTKPAATKPAETKPAETKPAETKPAETKPAETKPAEPKPAETKPAETKPAETKPVLTEAAASNNPVAVERPVIKPLVLETPITTKPASAEEEVFVFKPMVPAPPPARPAVTAPPAAAKLPSADGPAASKPVADDKAAAIKADVPDKPAAPRPPAAEKSAPFKAAAAEALAAIRRYAAKKPAAEQPEPVKSPPAAKIEVAPAPTPKPAAAAPSVAKEDRFLPEFESAPKPAAARPATAPPRIADQDPFLDFAPNPAPAPPPVATPAPAPPPSAAKPAIPPPPGATIGKPDPYPVDVLLALTSVFQRAPAIEAALLGQAQFPGRPPHLVVALSSAESWDKLMNELGPTMRKALPSGRAVEFTPLPGGMFEEYFSTEAQPFFKKR